jgi:flagellar biogenesis protein FliO
VFNQLWIWMGEHLVFNLELIFRLLSDLLIVLTVMFSVWVVRKVEERLFRQTSKIQDDQLARPQSRKLLR